MISAGVIGVRPVADAVTPAAVAASHATHGVLHPLSSAVQHVRPQADLMSSAVAVLTLALVAFGCATIGASVAPRRTHYRFASRAPPHSDR
jgi:hypothetical protein